MSILSNKNFKMSFGRISPELITLNNVNGLVALFTNYGARWVSMLVPDRKGILADVLLGFDTIDGYQNAAEQYHGAIVGRVCGRINKASFSLSGIEYQLAANDAYGYPHPNHLHGGILAFHNRIWQWTKQIDTEGNEAVTFTYFSPDGEEGYPGNLNVSVTYTLKPSGVLRMEIVAETDRQTPVNLTNHAFFNLQGNQEPKNILSHQLMINSDVIVDCNQELIPTGKLLSVKGSTLDFSVPRTIANSLTSAHSQIQQGSKGFSIAYALSPRSNGLTLAARLEDETSGRKMEIYTNQPSIQVYTAYFMDGTDIGKDNLPYYASAGIALETQGFPDAPNQENFPSVFVNKEDIYSHQTEYVFFV